ncbi:hypothetical protein BUALT_Bualt13G0109400 [Buddleja alternifolia]|uniref:AAA+ ATPase domain-containing protein n=1 Tax=Buddleja alternifolia TaxID=168488 RepID=A0AAV6WVG9_9LAMI|nr:hypothetical protein BUALT_Bualt13G0109400 [Buddleja alternifolia]
MVQPSSKREGFSTIPNVKWDDVGGLDHLRQEFDRYIFRCIKFPEYYEDLGLNLETGFLLYGPPGCGKTLIAKAVANEVGANFIHIKGPQLLNKYVGESELALQTIFSRARTNSPCVIFFDEVDALTTNRSKEGGWVVERLVNQLLIELDGAEQRRGVYVIGATNRPEVMDSALLRSGRFGNFLYVPLPSPDEQGMILKALARKKPIDAIVDLMAIGKDIACENLSGADLSALISEAVMVALDEKLTLSPSAPSTIKGEHFKRALEKISPSVSDKRGSWKRFYAEVASAERFFEWEAGVFGRGDLAPMLKDFYGMDKDKEKEDLQVFMLLHHSQMTGHLRLWMHPKASLLMGPPRCGKTMFARAIANDSGLPFYEVSATDLVTGLITCIDESNTPCRPGDYVVFIGATNRSDGESKGMADGEYKEKLERHVISMDDFETLAYVVKTDANFTYHSISYCPEVAISIQPSSGFSNILNVKWDDVGGYAHIKEDLKHSVVYPIKFPELYKGFVEDASKTRCILYGPTCCGKTLIAIAVASEAGANFKHIKNFEGLDSELAVQKIFSHARACSPCLLFIDEVHFTLGACWFGKLLHVPLPSPVERLTILKVAVRKRIDATVDLMAIGKDGPCEDLNGAHLKGIIDEAAWTLWKEEVKKDLASMLKDFYGMDKVKEKGDLQVFLLLHHSQMTGHLGLRMHPKAILLMGPPRYGKSMFARAIANDFGLPFYEVSATDLVTGLITCINESNIPCRPGDYVAFIGATNRSDGESKGMADGEYKEKLERHVISMNDFEVTCIPILSHNISLHFKEEEVMRESVVGGIDIDFAFDLLFNWLQEFAISIQPSSGFSNILNMKWDDVGGYDHIKEDLKHYVVYPIKLPELYKGFAEDASKTRCILYGPTGCGKTLIAMAVANEARTNFRHIKNFEGLDNELTGQTIFSHARACSPCLLFIDEVHFTLGRFGKLLHVPLPSPVERVTILKVLARKRIDATVDLMAIGKDGAYEDLSGAHLKGIIDEAAWTLWKEEVKKDESNTPCRPGDYVAFIGATNRSDGESKGRADGEYKEKLESLVLSMDDFENEVSVSVIIAFDLLFNRLQEVAISIQPSSGFSNILNVKWDDVGGYDHIKEDLKHSVVYPIKFPELYKGFAEDASKTRCLLYGPTCCGKTLIAMAVANEAGANFKHIKSSNVLFDEDMIAHAVSYSTRLQKAGLKRKLLEITPAYVAPGTLARKGYDVVKVDICSCGVTLFVLMAGYFPFHDQNVMAMNKKIYEARITIPEIMNNKWFKKGFKHVKFCIEDYKLRSGNDYGH